MKHGAIVVTILGSVLGLYDSAAGATAEPSGDYSAGALTLHFDGRGAMQLRKASKILVNARYAIDGGTITFTDESGPMACDAAQASGKYRWTLARDTLTFVVVDDPCEGRAADLPRAWTRSQ